MRYTFGITLLLLAPAIVFAAPRTFSDLAGNVVQILNAGIGTIIILGLVIYFYGVATSIPRLKADDGERLRAHFLWGIIALFVMVSVWGILGLLRNTLFGGGAGGGDFGGGGVLCTSIDNCPTE